jgi:hypothetical protein
MHSHKIHQLANRRIKLAIRSLPPLEVELVIVARGREIFGIKVHIRWEMELGSVADNLLQMTVSPDKLTQRRDNKIIHTSASDKKIICSE